ncbi:hypothetical protein [Paenibacillus sp. Y412MC10]|uniref:hypothetical protein n=1 Tax=Geobacillus sp. (strain Y412MC10) TaxID=481743 RepID=UPI0011AB38BE|nr:hypothetical protein [Paenibacillus sp. Y412MC10]
MKKMTWFIGILLLMVAFSLLIYPTPYRYLEFEYSNNGGKVPVKLNVITGKTQVFSPQYGWQEINN